MGFDESDFLFSTPAFELFFAGDGVGWVGEGFVVHENVDVVAFGEAGDGFLFVFGVASAEVVGHADVEPAGMVGEDVDVVGVGGHWWMWFCLGAFG